VSVVNQNLDPLDVVRADIERYLRWPQDVRRYHEHWRRRQFPAQ
jgi:hypothetical protein